MVISSLQKSSVTTRHDNLKSSTNKRTSIYRGVTRHRRTGRYEAHLWDKNCWNQSQNKKGRQVYIGAYYDEETAAHAYDLAALKYWGQHTILNFPLPTYEKEVAEMEGQSKEEYICSLRRKSSGFSRGVSKYRGVARHHQNGKWEARIGRVFGNKYIYLGTFGTEEEAATAYDRAAIEFLNLSHYINGPNNPQPIMQNPNQELGMGPTQTTTLPGGAAEPELPRRSFPDDIQTSFDILDSSTFVEEDHAYGIVFGDYGSFVSDQVLEYEIETN